MRQGLDNDNVDIFHVHQDGCLFEIGPRGNMKAQFWDANRFQLNKGCHFAEMIIDDGTIDIHVANLSLAIQQVGVDLFFLEAY